MTDPRDAPAARDAAVHDADASDVPDDLEPEDAFGHHAITGQMPVIATDTDPDDDDIDV